MEWAPTAPDSFTSSPGWPWTSPDSPTSLSGPIAAQPFQVLASTRRDASASCVQVRQS
jgi:hypothetical protein